MTNDKGNNVTKTVSMPIEMHREVLERMAKLKLKKLSEYVQNLVRQDLARRGDLTLPETSKSASNRPKK